MYEKNQYSKEKPSMTKELNRREILSEDEVF